MKLDERQRFQQLSYLDRTCKKLGEPFPVKLQVEYRELKAKDLEERKFLMQAMKSRPEPIEPMFPIKRRGRRRK